MYKSYIDEPLIKKTRDPEEFRREHICKIAQALSTLFQYKNECSSISLAEGENSDHTQGFSLSLITTNNIHDASSGSAPAQALNSIYAYLLAIAAMQESADEVVLRQLKDERATLVREMSNDFVINSFKDKSSFLKQIQKIDKNILITLLLDYSEHDVTLTLEDFFQKNCMIRMNFLLYLSFAIHCSNALKKIEKNILMRSLTLKPQLENTLGYIDSRDVHAEIRQLSQLLYVGYFTDEKFKGQKRYMGTSKRFCADCHLFWKSLIQVISELDQAYTGGEIYCLEDPHSLSFDKWQLPESFLIAFGGNEAYSIIRLNSEQVRFAQEVILKFLHFIQENSTEIQKKGCMPPTKKSTAGEVKDYYKKARKKKRSAINPESLVAQKNLYADSSDGDIELDAILQNFADFTREDNEPATLQKPNPTVSLFEQKIGTLKGYSINKLSLGLKTKKWDESFFLVNPTMLQVKIKKTLAYEEHKQLHETILLDFSQTGINTFSHIVKNDTSLLYKLVFNKTPEGQKAFTKLCESLKGYKLSETLGLSTFFTPLQSSSIGDLLNSVNKLKEAGDEKMKSNHCFEGKDRYQEALEQLKRLKEQDEAVDVSNLLKELDGRLKGVEQIIHQANGSPTPP